MWNNIRNTPPFPSNLELTRIAGLTAYTSIVNSSLGRGVRSQAESVVQQKDGAGRVTKKTYNFPNGAKIEDLLFYPSDPAGLVTFEIRGAYTDLNGMPLITGGGYDAGFDGRYGSVRSIAYRRKANQAPIEVIATNVDGTVFIDTYTYVDSDDIEPDRIDQGAPIIPTIGYNLALSASTGVIGTPITLTYNFPAVHAACQLVPTVYGGTGTFAPATINVAANAPQATLTFTPTSNGVLAIGTANNAGFRDPAYQAYVIGNVDNGAPPTSDGTSPFAGLKLRERAIRTSAVLDNQRRPISVTYYYADNSTILDRYRYASLNDSDPAEILFNTTPSAPFLGNNPVVPSGTPPVYGLKLRELASHAYSVLDAQGRAISTTYFYADGSTTLDRYRYATTTDIDATEALFDTTLVATFLGSPVTPPINSPNLGTRIREQSLGAYSTLDAQGRAIETVYYYGDFVRVLDRSRYTTITDSAPTETLFNSTPSASYLGAPTGTFTASSLDESTREQSLQAYSNIDAQGRAENTIYRYSDRLILDKYRYAALDDTVPIESILDTTPSAAFLNAGSAPVASSYTISFGELLVAGSASQLTILGDSPFDTGTIITPSIAGVSGTFNPTSLDVSGTRSRTVAFTPSSTGIGNISASNNRSLSDPTTESVSVVRQQITWANLANGASASGAELTLPSTANASATFALDPAWQEIQFLADPSATTNKGNWIFALSDTASSPEHLYVPAPGTYNRICNVQFISYFSAQIRYSVGLGNQSDGNGIYVNAAFTEPSARLISLLRTGANLTVRSSTDGVTWRTDASLADLIAVNATYFLKVVRVNDADANGVPTSQVVRVSPVIF